MTNEAFWTMTPRQFSLLVDRHQRRLKQEDRRAGGVIAMLYNINRDSTKDPTGLDWDDFFPEWKEKPVPSEEQIFEAMLLWAKSTEGLSA